MLKKRRRKENEERGRKRRREEGRGERGDIDGVLHLSTPVNSFSKTTSNPPLDAIATLGTTSFTATFFTGIMLHYRCMHAYIHKMPYTELVKLLSLL